jgi:small subunit ribosomal protein S20
MRPPQRAFLTMPNIKQQKKRVRIAARQRLENLRYRSTVKTFTRRLREAVEDGDAARVSDEHRTLVRWIDKAAARGALHKNAAARKKAQAAGLVSGGAEALGRTARPRTRAGRR